MFSSEAAAPLPSLSSGNIGCEDDEQALKTPATATHEPRTIAPVHFDRSILGIMPDR